MAIDYQNRPGKGALSYSRREMNRGGRRLRQFVMRLGAVGV
jgi:hypothetical protein